MEHKYFITYAFACSWIAPVKSFMMICPHVSPRLPLDGFPWNLTLKTLLNIFIEYPDLTKTGKKCGSFYMETEIHFSFAGEIKAFSSREFVSGCFDSQRIINTTRTRRHVTVNVYCQSFQSLVYNWICLSIFNLPCVINIPITSPLLTVQALRTPLILPVFCRTCKGNQTVLVIRYTLYILLVCWYKVVQIWPGLICV